MGPSAVCGVSVVWAKHGEAIARTAAKRFASRMRGKDMRNPSQGNILVLLDVGKAITQPE